MTLDSTPNIGLLIIATNKYISFLQPLLESADKFFLKNCNVSYYIFSNKFDSTLKTKRNIKFFNINHEPWPNMTLKRYDFFNKEENSLQLCDYLYYCDADMKFVNDVGTEILSDLVGTIHPGFFNSNNIQYTYERNPLSQAYIPFGQGNRYYAGGFNGGSSKLFLKMAKNIVLWRNLDETKGLIPIWHDESYMNKYMLLNRPTLELSPSYCYPEHWNLPFVPRLISLHKDNHGIRLET